MKLAPLAVAAALLPAAAALAANPPVPSVRLHQPMRVGGLQVTPLAVTEDSRCPATVTCVWAGRVVVRVALVTPTARLTRSLTLHEPLTIGRQVVTLEAVGPRRTVAGVAPGAYRFSFSIRPTAPRALSRPGIV